MNLLITGAWRHTEEQLAQIRRLGHHIVLMSDEADSLPCDYESVEGVICNGLFIHHPIDKFVNLKYIQLTSAGLDRLPVDYVLSHNIEIHNARGVYSIPMAEFALSSVLSIYKQAEYFRLAQVSKAWSKHRGLRELFGKRVCIVGCGSVGTECAKRFSAMGSSVIGVDLVPEHKEGYDSILSVGSLKDAVSTSDIIVLTLPLTDKTKGIIGGSVLDLLPYGAVIVNLSRGSIIDTAALLDVMKKRPDVTAVLDVFDNEPLSAEDPIWDTPNLLITPHNSFVGDGNRNRLWNVIYDNLKNN